MKIYPAHWGIAEIDRIHLLQKRLTQNYYIPDGQMEWLISQLEHVAIQYNKLLDALPEECLYQYTHTGEIPDWEQDIQHAEAEAEEANLKTSKALTGLRELLKTLEKRDWYV